MNEYCEPTLELDMREPADPSESETRWPVQWRNRLQRLATTISGVVDAGSMARTSVAEGQLALEADAGAVFLVTPDGEAVEIAYASGFQERSVNPWVRFPLSANLPATDAIRRCEMVLLRSREELGRCYPELARTPGVFIHDSWVAVPLVADRVCFGALGFSFISAQAFETQEVAFLRVVADQCAQGLHRAQLVERERRSTARLRVLAEASRVFAATSPDVDSVVAVMAAEVLAHVGDSCSIALASADGEWLDVATIHDRDPERQCLLREVAGTLRMRRGEGISGQVLATGTSVLLPSIAPNEMAARTAPSVAQRIEALRVRSFLAVPLKTRGRTLGTITTSRYEEGNPFTDDDRALLEDLADRAALAIENARLHEVERQARARAEDADQRKDEFLAMLGHELRNPLAPIRDGARDHAAAAAGDDRQVPGRARSSTAAGRAAVAPGRRSAGRLAHHARQDRTACRSRSTSADRGALALETEPPAAVGAQPRRRPSSCRRCPRACRATPSACTQVISNLLNNAAKYTDPGGRVRLRVASEGGEASSPSPTTAWASPPTCSSACSICSCRCARARDRIEGGLGIGLTLVRRLVEMHGGTVRVASAGEGPRQRVRALSPAVDRRARGGERPRRRGREARRA